MSNTMIADEKRKENGRIRNIRNIEEMGIPESERDSSSSQYVWAQRTPAQQKQMSNIWTCKSRVVRKRLGECVCKGKSSYNKQCA